MESFRNLSKSEIFEIIDDQWRTLISTVNHTKAENTRRNSTASRKISNSVSVITNMIEDFKIEIKGDILQITSEFETLSHEDMLMIMYNHLCNQQDRISEIETNRQIDPRSTALRNKQNELSAGLETIKEMIMAFDIDLTEFRETMSDLCKLR